MIDKRPGLVFLIGICTIVLLAILASTLAEARRNATFATGTPQNVVQSYLQAISKDKKVKAFSYVARKSSCTQKDMDAAFGAPITRTIVQFARINGDRGTVGIRLELGYPSPYGGRVTMDHTFSLVRESNQWRLIGTIWPMESCPD